MQTPALRLFFLTSCAALTLIAACSDDSGSSVGVAGTAGIAGRAPTSGSSSGGSQSGGGQSGGGQSGGGNQAKGGHAGLGGTDSQNLGGLAGSPEVDGGASSGGDAGLAGEGGSASDGGATSTAGAAGASDAGSDAGGAASGGAGAGGTESGGAAGANSQPEVPEELQEFVAAVAAAVAKAQQEGSKNCARAIPPVPVTSVDDAWLKVRDFVALVVGVKPGALKEDSTKCNLPATALCANLFQNDVYHSDGRLGDALHPFAQQVDSDTKTERVVIFTPQKDNISQPPVVVTAGVSDGFLLGVAFFDGRSTCE